MKPATHPRSWWPFGLIAFFAVFIGWLGTFAVIAVRNSMDLVRPDYYEQEVRYQEQIDRENRTARLSAAVQISYDAAAGNVALQLSAAQAARWPAGTVKFYRPSDASLDREIPLAVNAFGHQVVDTTQLRRGNWKLRVTWRVAGEEFFSEQSIVLTNPPT